MIRSTLKKILGSLLGRKTPPPVTRPTPARQPPPRPTAPEPEEDHGHDHGHSHGHSHDHGGGEAAKAEPAPAPKPAAAPKPAPAPKPELVAEAPAHDHDHGHSHGHDHGHGDDAEAETAGKKPAKKTVDVLAEDTPNPNARKFTASVKIVEKGSISFNSAEEAEANPLAKALWACGGVKGVFAVKDFVTVTKEDSADWAKLSPKVIKAIKKAL